MNERIMDFGIRKELFDSYQDGDLRKIYFVKCNEKKKFYRIYEGKCYNGY